MYRIENLFEFNIYIYDLFDYVSSSNYVIPNDSMIKNQERMKPSSFELTGGIALASFRKYWGK
jgi:hypothetical protein